MMKIEKLSVRYLECPVLGGRFSYKKLMKMSAIWRCPECDVLLYIAVTNGGGNMLGKNIVPEINGLETKHIADGGF